METVHERLLERDKAVGAVRAMVEDLTKYATRLTAAEARALHVTRENKLLRFETRSPTFTSSSEALGGGGGGGGFHP